jgi:hypothetical protein
VAFQLVHPSKHDSLLKFVKTKITGDVRSKLIVRDLTYTWALLKGILEENYAVRRTLDYYACRKFSARQDRCENIASWGSRIDEMQTELREAAKMVCRPEELLRAIGLINHLGKACFIQGLQNAWIQIIVRSRGESILLSQAVEVSQEQECAILSISKKSVAGGNTVRCTSYNRLGHVTSKCMYKNRFPPANARAVVSFMARFKCGRAGHIARDYRKRSNRETYGPRGHAEDCIQGKT